MKQYQLVTDTKLAKLVAQSVYRLFLRVILASAVTASIADLDQHRLMAGRGGGDVDRYLADTVSHVLGDKNEISAVWPVPLNAVVHAAGRLAGRSGGQIAQASR